MADYNENEHLCGDIPPKSDELLLDIHQKEKSGQIDGTMIHCVSEFEMDSVTNSKNEKNIEKCKKGLEIGEIIKIIKDGTYEKRVKLINNPEFDPNMKLGDNLTPLSLAVSYAKSYEDYLIIMMLLKLGAAPAINFGIHDDGSETLHLITLLTKVISLRMSTEPKIDISPCSSTVDQKNSAYEIFRLIAQSYIEIGENAEFLKSVGTKGIKMEK